MEVDHHDPTLRGAARNKYDNLFLATRHCNGAKSDHWPDSALRKKGIRLLNPCKEQDYGEHIYEHPITHRLIGVTPAGRYHITTCDLNAEHFVNERKERAAIQKLLQQTPMTMKGPGAGTAQFPSNETLLLQEQFKKMIPPIVYLPTDHPKYEEDIKIVEALKNLGIG